MSKFKVGDKVRIIDANSADVNPGDEGVVESAFGYDDYDTEYAVRVPETGLWSFTDEHLELVDSSKTTADYYKEKSKVGRYLMYVEDCCDKIKKFETKAARTKFIAEFALKHQGNDDSWFTAVVDGKLKVY